MVSTFLTYELFYIVPYTHVILVYPRVGTEFLLVLRTIKCFNILIDLFRFLSNILC